MRLRRAARTFAIAASCGIFCPAGASAQWMTNGTPACTAANDQINPTIASDGQKGALLAWSDSRGAPYSLDIFAQRVDSLGVSKWGANGVAVCTFAGNQTSPVVVSDGSGGAIIAWNDPRAGAPGLDIYVQRINAAGVPQWTADGVVVCDSLGDQFGIVMVPDGAGGAILAWEDHRRGSGFSTTDIFAQRLNASGVPQWTADGVPVCTFSDDQFVLAMTTSTANSAIITWVDGRELDFHIFAQKISASGTLAWTPADGVPICEALEGQFQPAITADGAGGAIIVWEDERNDLTTETDLYAQRVNSAGVTQWTNDGVALCNANNSQFFAAAVSDGANGAIVAWQDNRGGSSDIFARRINASGTPQWTTDGVALCTAGGIQRRPFIETDQAGGAIVTWDDFRSSFYNGDVYAQRVNAAGVLQWATNGLAMTSAPSDQAFPRIASDGSGGAIVGWEDARSGTSSDIYIQRVTANGTVSPPTVDVPGELAISAGLQMALPHPNPTWTVTSLDFALASAARVSAAVYDLEGRAVRSLLDGAVLPAGSHTLHWDGRDSGGLPAPHGIYLVKLRAGVAFGVRKVALIR